MAMPDLQGVWETAVREVALEGSNGCTLERLWKLVELDTPSQQGGSGSTPQQPGEEQPDDDGSDPREFVKAWLWRSIVSRRGRELFLATYNDQGESNNLKRGDPEDSRLAAIKDIPTLEKEQRSVGVVASRPVRLRALGLDTATLKSVTLVSPAYLQVLEVVGRHRGWGASTSEVLDGVNRIIGSDKKDDYVEVVTTQTSKYRVPNKTREGAFLGSQRITAMQLYPVYDRLASTGLIFKSVVQKPATGNEEDGEQKDGMFRFVVLYLKRFKDSILVPPGTKLEPTAKEVFLEMLVEHLLEAGGSGGIVPWYNIRKDLFLDKNASGRLRNFLKKENKIPNFPIRIQLLDIRAMDYVNSRKGRRLEWCVSLKAAAALLQATRREDRGLLGEEPERLRDLEGLHEDGAGAGGGAAGGAAGAGLGDVNWSDDDELDAMVDDIGREVDEAAAAAAAKSLDKIIVDRVKFEMNPVYPPEGCSMAERLAWLQMTPKDRRKSFVLHELGLCKSIPVLKVIQLIKLLEGPGPMLQKATLDTVVAELVQEGRIKTATTPQPKRWAWRGRMKTFGHGEMILLPDAKTDPESLAEYAENFYAVETAVHRESTRIKAASHFSFL
ncbi:unnamed protein product [Ectocarpus sp. 6 AP-2014]